MKPFIQKSARLGLNLFMLAGLLASILFLSNTQTSQAAPLLSNVNYAYTATDWTVNHNPCFTDPYIGEFPPSDYVTLVNPNATVISTGDAVTVQFDFSPALYVRSSALTSLVVAIRMTDPNYSTYGGYPIPAQTINFAGANVQNVTSTFAGSDNYQSNPYTPVIAYEVSGLPDALIQNPTQDAMINSMSVTFTAPGGGGSNPDFSATTFIARADITVTGSCADPDPMLSSTPFVMCLPGTYLNGASCVPADPGFFVSESGATEQTPCPLGTFQPLFGSASCASATLGYFVAQLGSAAQTECAEGTYQPFSGQITCYQAAPGTFVATTGAIASTPCPLGTFQPFAGAASCASAPAGRFVAAEGQIAATDCAAGTYQPYTGQTSCLLADPGYFVDTAGAIEQTLCPAGYTSETGAIACTPEITNTAPTATPGGPYLGAINAFIPFDGSASSDPEGDPLTYAWTFGDNGTGTGVMPTHSYPDAGVYAVCLTVNDGSLASEPECTFSVVYDPSAGFVTGGGWITSPAGALVSDPDATGKGKFGFVAKYKKNGTLESETEFELSAGDFHFHASSAQWMYISGAKAQIYGTGQVEESSHSYGFSVTVLDGALNGGVDMFRIRIWDTTDGNAVVYDSQLGDPAYADPITPLGGGNIKVHK